MVYSAEEHVCKYTCLGAFITYSILQIILKEREERKQQRLQDNAASPAPAEDGVPGAESGGGLAPEQGEPWAPSCRLRPKEFLSWGDRVQQATQNPASLRPAR